MKTEIETITGKPLKTIIWELMNDKEARMTILETVDAWIVGNEEKKIYTEYPEPPDQWEQWHDELIIDIALEDDED